jgi:phage portal protein BeeE
MLLGIPGDNTYSNYREANRAFWRQTILPLLGRTCDAMSHWFSGHLGEELRIDFDADRIEGLALEREALWKRIGNADFLEEDEKRRAVGYGPREAT